MASPPERHTRAMVSPPSTHRATGRPSRRPAHAARPMAGTGRLLLGGAAAAALLIALAAGTSILLQSGGPATSTPTSARLITVSPTVPPGRP